MGREEMAEIRARVREEVFSLEACSRCCVVTDYRSMEQVASNDFICQPCRVDQDLVAEETQWAGGAD